MNAYVDLSYIFHVITLFNLPYYFKRIINVRIKKIELLSLIIFSLVLYFNVFVFEEYKYINYIFLLIYFLLVYKNNFFKYYMLYLFVYYSNIAVTMIFTTNIYIMNGVVFLNTEKSFFLILLESMNILFIEIIMLTIRSIKLLKNYKTKISIKIGIEYKEYSAYIDSGNTLLIEGLPVIFLKEKYFTSKKYNEMYVSGIGERKCKYFKTNVVFNNGKREVICASGGNEGFKGCDCLINIHLLEEIKDETIE